MLCLAVLVPNSLRSQCNVTVVDCLSTYSKRCLLLLNQSFESALAVTRQYARQVAVTPSSAQSVDGSGVNSVSD